MMNFNAVKKVAIVAMSTALILTPTANATQVISQSTGVSVVSFTIEGNLTNCTVEPLNISIMGKNIDGNWHSKNIELNVLCHGKNINYLLSLENDNQFKTHKKHNGKLPYVTFFNKKTKCSTDLFLKAESSGGYVVLNKGNNLIPDGHHANAMFSVHNGQSAYQFAISTMYRSTCPIKDKEHKETIALNTNLNIRH